MPNLVIVESPSKANTIKGYLGPNYKVVASIGHVRDLPKSTLGIDIENKFEARYINIRGKGKIINELKKEAKSCSKVYLATDPDREGEAISWHLATALGLPTDQPNRTAFNELTKTAIKNAINTPRKIDMDLVNSQQARRILDRIVGYKLSPFLWKKVKSGLSAGRVQSVATRIIVEREEEIRAFVPVEYWTIDAALETSAKRKVKARFFGDASGKLALDNEEDANKVLSAVENSPFVVKSIKKALRYISPPAPFSTSTLLQDASRKLGFQSQRIMRVAQELYEGVDLGAEYGGTSGLITYMRTDSLRISADATEAAKGFITEKFGGEYYPENPRVYKTSARTQDAHEAIRPVNVELEPEKLKKQLSSDQYRLYKLIWSRFVASQMASAEHDTITADIDNAGYIFRASGYTVKFQGFKAVYEESEETTDENSPAKTKLPPLSEGEELQLDKILPEQHFTEPPPRFNEGSLIKFFKDKGIGRPSTYTPIITTIINRGYVSREAKALKPTPLGEITTKLMIEHFPDIVDYKFTAKMEDDLDEIENGKLTVYDVLNEFYTGFEKELARADAAVEKGDIEIPVEETDIDCEKCGSRMIIKNGRYGKFAACPNYPECKNTKPLNRDGKPITDSDDVVKTDIKCDLCGSEMVKRNGRYGSFLACIRYPECKNTKKIAKSTGVPCPLCGAQIINKHARNKVTFYSCERYPECNFSSWDLPLNEKCPDCNEMLYRKKGKPLIVCNNKECGYKRAAEPEEQSASAKEADGSSVNKDSIDKNEATENQADENE